MKAGMEKGDKVLCMREVQYAFMSVLARASCIVFLAVQMLKILGMNEG